MWTQKHQGETLPELVEADEFRETLTKCAVADLVVILRKENGCLGRQVRARLAARLFVKRKGFSLKRETFG